MDFGYKEINELGGVELYVDMFWPSMTKRDIVRRVNIVVIDIKPVIRFGSDIICSSLLSIMLSGLVQMLYAIDMCSFCYE